MRERRKPCGGSRDSSRTVKRPQCFFHARQDHRIRCRLKGTAMRITGWSFGSSRVRLLVLPAIAIAGCAAWMALPGPSDAEGQSAATPSPVIFAQNALLDDA